MPLEKSTSKVRNGLYKRGDSWYILYKLDGKQHRKSYGSDKKKAEVALAALKQQIKVGQAFDDWSGLEQLVRPPSKRKFEEVAQAYIDAKVGVKASTLVTYKDILTNHLLPAFGPTEIRKITKESIASFRAALVRRKLSPRRVNSIVQLLSSMLRDCVDDDVIAKNPADAVKRLEEPKTDVDPMTREELEAALEHVDPHFRPLFTCLAWTGARPNELIALRWGDIDWRRREIAIKKGRVRGHEGLPKSKASQRHIPMLPPVVDAMTQLKNGCLANIGDYIFVTKRGEPIGKHLDRIWTRALKKAGLKHRASYQLRHTFASIALEQGASPAWVSKVLGHGSMEITFRYYARFIKGTEAANEQLMSRMFEPSRTESKGG